VTQAELNLEPRTRLPERGSQCYEILYALKAGKRLTVAKALSEHGVYALSQRVGELKRMGWPICTRMVEVRPGTRIAEYFMPEGGSYA
jgi:hypothetical protein